MGKRVLLVDGSSCGIPFSGISRYVDSVVTAVQSDPDVSFRIVVVSHKKTKSRIKKILLAPLYSRFAWKAFTFPVLAYIHRADVVWVPDQRVLCWLPFMSVVVTVHDVVWVRFPETMTWFGRVLDALSFKVFMPGCKAVCCVSSFTARELCRVSPSMAGQLSKGVILPPSCALRFNESVQPFLARLGLEKNTSRSIFIAVGTVEPRKNISGLINMFAEVVEAANDTPLLVILGKPGWGDTPNWLMETVSKYPWLIWLDDADDATLVGAYLTANGLLALSDYEGFGIPVLEAVIAGCPVLTRPHMPALELVRDERLVTTHESKTSQGQWVLDHLAEKPLESVRRRAVPEKAERFQELTDPRAMINVFESVSGR